MLYRAFCKALKAFHTVSVCVCVCFCVCGLYEGECVCVCVGSSTHTHTHTHSIEAYRLDGGEDGEQMSLEENIALYS